MREQRVARVRDATVMLVAAASVGMRGLGQPPEGGVDLRRLERALHRQVQDLAVLLIVVVEIQPKQEGPALFPRFEAQIDLILPPSAARHDETLAKGDPALRFKFVETEWPDDAIGRRQKGALPPSPSSMRPIVTLSRIPIEPFQTTHSSLSVMPRAFMHEPTPRAPRFCTKGFTTAGRPRVHARSKPKRRSRRRQRGGSAL